MVSGRRTGSGYGPPHLPVMVGTACFASTMRAPGSRRRCTSVPSSAAVTSLRDSMTARAAALTATVSSTLQGRIGETASAQPTSNGPSRPARASHASRDVPIRWRNRLVDPGPRRARASRRQVVQDRRVRPRDGSAGSVAAMRITDEDFELARKVCTAQQVRALNLWRRGWGMRAIAETMDLDRSTVRQHVRAGNRRIAAAKRLCDEPCAA